jgi:NAD(P)-dependent dehydrogenase (short-subunit alcohol dehydrogenase family)
MLLQDRVAIVTGGAAPRGIGRATAALFAEHGARVAVLDLKPDAAEEAARALPGSGHRGYACDVSRPEDCAKAVAAVLADFGRADVLVNNASIAQPLRTLEITPEAYEQVLNVNLRGTFSMCQAVMSPMRARRQGAIVNIASIAGQRGGGIFGGPHYAASKAGVIGLTKAIARELAPDNVRVNAVAPGFVETDIFAGKLTPEIRSAAVAMIPMGRAGTPREIAGCCLFLASDLASFVTGATIDANGGSNMR